MFSSDIDLIRKNIRENYQGMCRDAGGALRYPFLTPGSESYSDVLWDWDSWLSNVALRQILLEFSDENEKERILKYERGCVLNFLSYCDEGYIPICIGREPVKKITPAQQLATNMHKPVLAQHAAFLVKEDNGNAEWLREQIYHLQLFVNFYHNHYRHRQTGLYFWHNDFAIGVDNDPCTYYRPDRSSGSIYLNCLMYRELLAMSYLCNCLSLDEIAAEYGQSASELKKAVLTHCWDERDGFFYSVDLNLKPVLEPMQPDDNNFILHLGNPRPWDCLIQRIGVWSGFLPMWAEIASPDQAARMAEHCRDTRSFCAPYGIRTLSKWEKMYSVTATHNPSSWLGPIWGVSNYLVFRGLIKYGYDQDARDLAEKTICLFSRDIQRFNAMHEYYQPENGEPVLNRGFQNWNYLVLNMAAWVQGKNVISEF